MIFLTSWFTHLLISAHLPAHPQCCFCFIQCITVKKENLSDWFNSACHFPTQSQPAYVGKTAAIQSRKVLHTCTDILAHLFPLPKDQLRVRLPWMYWKVFHTHSVNSLHWIPAAASLSSAASLSLHISLIGQPSFLRKILSKTENFFYKIL